MSEPYIGDIRMIGFSFAPEGWAQCNGQLLPIGQNQALFSLLGTTYGGDGQTTFALPDLRGRVPMHMAPGYPQGMAAGANQHTISLQEMPGHTHSLQASTAVSHYGDPAGKAFGNVEAGALNTFAPGGGNTGLASSSLGPAGGSLPHENRQPTTAINFVIALEGIFPSPQ